MVEFIFGIPGMGLYVLESIMVRDYNAIMAVLLKIGGPVWVNASAAATILTKVLFFVNPMKMPPMLAQTETNTRTPAIPEGANALHRYNPFLARRPFHRLVCRQVQRMQEDFSGFTRIDHFVHIPVTGHLVHVDEGANLVGHLLEH